MLWDQQHHYTTLVIGQIANVHPYPSVHQPCPQTQSYSDHRRSMLWPKNGCINGAHVISVARRGTLLILQIYWVICLISVLLALSDLNDARATSSLSTHCGFTWLTKSCVTNERCVPVSNITVASVIPWLQCVVTQANCIMTEGCDADMSPGGAEYATLTNDAFTSSLDDGGEDNGSMRLHW